MHLFLMLIEIHGIERVKQRCVIFAGGVEELMARKREIDDRREFVHWLDQRLGDMVPSTPYYLLDCNDRYAKWHHSLSRQKKAANRHFMNLYRLMKMDEWKSVLDGDDEVNAYS